MQNLIEKAIYIFIGAVVVAGFLWVANQGFNKQERNECHKWQAEARQYPGYYLTGWQKEQCDRWGVQIDAEVVE